MAKQKVQTIPMTKVQRLTEELRIAKEEEKAERKKRTESRILAVGKIVLTECESDPSLSQKIMKLVYEKGSEIERNWFSDEMNEIANLSTQTAPQQPQDILGGASNSFPSSMS